MGSVRAETKKVPRGTKEDLEKWILGQLKSARDAQRDWRERARECYRFYSGDQWDDETKSTLEGQGRAIVVFNRVARTIRGVAGTEVQNRQEVKYLPRELSDSGGEELLSAAADWVRDNCDAEDEESEVFTDLLICGMGCSETRMDYSINPDGEIIKERGDPLELFWDASSRKKNLGDKRWIARVKKWSRDDVRDRWPEWEPGGASTDWMEDKPKVHEATPPFYDKGGDQGSEVAKTVSVVLFQWYELEPMIRVQGPNGVETLDEEQFAAIQPQVFESGLQFVRQKTRKYYQAWMVGDTLMEWDDAPIEHPGFTIQVMTGERDAENASWFGLVSLMIDPQRWANKWLSQIMHILNSNAKGGLLAETDAFENVRNAEDEWSDPSAITWVRPGALVNGKIQQKQMTQMPTGIERLLQYAIEAITDVPGVNQELLGLATGDQPGVLEGMRKQAGITMLATYFDSLRRYRKEDGRVLAEFIRKYISDGRLIRIKGDSQQYIPLLRDRLLMEYDVVVDDAPSAPNQKQQTFAVLQQIVPQLLEAGIRMPAEALDYLPLPAGLIEKIKESAQGDMSDSNSPELQQQLQQTAQENQELKADRSMDAAKIQLEHEKLAVAREKQQLDAQIAMIQANATANQLHPRFEELAQEVRSSMDQMAQVLTAVLTRANIV